MTAMTLSQLYIYPVKSLAGIALSESDLEHTGLRFDRRWMIVTADGKFLTQRSQPQMALVHTRIENGQLILSKQRYARYTGCTDLKRIPNVCW